MVRSLLLFAHVAAAMGVVAALGIEGTALLQLRRATSAADLRAALHGFGAARRLGAASLAATVLSGIYLASAYWGWRGGWIGVGFASLVLVAVIGATMTGRRIAGLHDIPSDPDLDAGGRRLPDPQRDPISWISFVMRTAILAGIVFLMTVKPALAASLVAMAGAIAVGLLASVMSLHRPASPLPHDAARSQT